MSEEAKRKIQSYIIEPPCFQDCLKELAGADDTLRFGLMVQLVDVALADDQLESEEASLIKEAQQFLRISDEQPKAIDDFIKKVKEIRERGMDDEYAKDAIKAAGAAWQQLAFL